MNENLIRCFIAISIPGNILHEIERYISRLNQISTGVRWVKPSGIHLTLKFLGEQPAGTVKKISKELEDIEQISPPFELAVSGNGCFPNRKRPRVFWLGLEHDQKNSLFRLHQWIDAHLQPMGFAPEKRRFSPHLTIGRVKMPSEFNDLFDFWASNPFPVIKFMVNEVSLIQSVLSPQGAEYTSLHTYSLLPNT